MSELERLQCEFQSFVLDGAAGIERRILGTARFAVATRLSIYSDAYRSRLAEALENNYPMLAKLLGHTQFQDLARAYTERHRSAHFSIRWYGDRLPALLGSTTPYRGKPLLSELAEWEWNMTLAFDAANAAVARSEALAGLAPEQWAQLRFALHPSARMVSLLTNAPAVWRALNRDEAPPGLVLESTRRDWLIWRRGLDTFFRSLEHPESRALRILAHGGSFGSICEALALEIGEDSAPGEAAKLLSRWLEDELLAQRKD